MRSLVQHYTAPSLLIVAILAVAGLWYRFNTLRRWQGPYLLHLWSSHGVHLFDLVALLIELMLLLLLSLTLSGRFEHGS